MVTHGLVLLETDIILIDISVLLVLIVAYSWPLWDDFSHLAGYANMARKTTCSITTKLLHGGDDKIKQTDLGNTNIVLFSMGIQRENIDIVFSDRQTN